MKKLFAHLGLFISQAKVDPYSYDENTYVSDNEATLQEHKEYLKEIENAEDNRLQGIENKTSQLVSQTGIIFSLLSLFVPLFFDKISELNILFKVAFFILLLLSFLLYVLTIHHAIKIYNIKKYVYSRNSPNTVLKYQSNTLKSFTQIQIKDLLYSINKNVKTNNIIANNLIFAYRNFQIANILTAILGALLCVSLLFAHPKSNTTTIDNQIKIEGLNSNLNKISVAIDSIKLIQTIKCDTSK